MRNRHNINHLHRLDLMGLLGRWREARARRRDPQALECFRTTWLWYRRNWAWTGHSQEHASTPWGKMAGKCTGEDPPKRSYFINDFFGYLPAIGPKTWTPCCHDLPGWKYTFLVIPLQEFAWMVLGSSSEELPQWTTKFELRAPILAPLAPPAWPQKQIQKRNRKCPQNRHHYFK
jgi:hypothetical protein